MTGFTGLYVKGKGAASGQSLEDPSVGIIQMQLQALSRANHPAVNKFLTLLNQCCMGTINIDLKQDVERPKWQYIFRDVIWHPKIPPETLHYHPVQLSFNQRDHQAFWYMAGEDVHGSTKIEIIAPMIEGLVFDHSQLTIHL